MALSRRVKRIARTFVASAVSAILVFGTSAQAGGFKAQSAASLAPSWASKAVIYQVNTRAYSSSGKFTAVKADIPRLKKLGVNVLWLMPIHPIGVLNRKGSLGSPYSVKDYKGVNPELGSEADLRALISAAHASGMKVILDWVANHSAWDNAWVTQHKSWYTQDANGNIVPPNPDWSDVADLNFNNEELRAAMIDAMVYWVRDFDIDGYRADAAWGVDKAFWESAATALRALKPVWMVAETQDQPELMQNAFQADYGWHFKDMLYLMGGGAGTKIDFASELVRMQSSYANGAYPMLFITNHDENSWTGSLSTQFGKGAKTLSVLTFTVPGVPLIYNGQEVDSNKQLKFFDKDQIDWLLSSTRSKTATAFYTKLISLRLKNSSLWAGNAGGTITRARNDGTRILSFYRTKGANRVYVTMNISSLPATANVEWGADSKYYYRYSDGKKMKLPSRHTVSLKAWQFEIYSTVKP